MQEKVDSYFCLLDDGIVFLFRVITAKNIATEHPHCTHYNYNVHDFNELQYSTKVLQHLKIHNFSTKIMKVIYLYDMLLRKPI